MPPISATRTDRVSKILFWVGILIIPTILIIQVLVYQPFFGHYEDGFRLQFVADLPLHESLRASFFRAGSSYGYWGASGLSQLWSHVAYELGESGGSTLFYLSNSLQVLFGVIIFVIAILLFSRNRFSYLALVSGVLAACVWPFTFEMQFFPGMDEKGMILTAGLGLLAIRVILTIGSTLTAYLLLPIIPLVMLLNKSQVLIFAVGFLVDVLTWKVAGRFRKAAIVGAIVTTAIFQLWHATTASYSSGVRTGSFIANLLSPYGILVLIVTSFLFMFSLLNLIPKVQERLLSRAIPELLIPVSMMMAFCIGIGLWGTRNYWFSIFGVMFGSAVAVVVGNLKSVRLQQLATVGLIVVTVGWTLYRIPQVFEPLHGIGAFTQGQIAKDLADEGAVIYTSCVEGSGHFNYYTERKWGVTPEFKPLEGGVGYAFGVPDSALYVFGDRRLCAAPGEMTEWDVIWASPGDDGFRLYKRPA
jgi:hypothetical protein